MPAYDGLAWTFDTVASAYEKMRPGYPEALYRAVFDYAPVGAGSCVLEIGGGGGQATEPVLKVGCELTAVEYGAQFSALLRQKFACYPTFSVVTGKFEDVALLGATYDLIFSASAFHWIPEEIGYPRVYDLLKPGGAFARFANHPFRDKGNPALSRRIDELYAQYYYPYHGKEPRVLQEYTEQQAAERARVAERYGFSDIRFALFYRTRTFTAKEYVALLGTYSDHIAMECTVRETFFSAVEQAINHHGGTYTVYDTIDLQLARRP